MLLFIRRNGGCSWCCVLIIWVHIPKRTTLPRPAMCIKICKGQRFSFNIAVALCLLYFSTPSVLMKFLCGCWDTVLVFFGFFFFWDTQATFYRQNAVVLEPLKGKKLSHFFGIEKVKLFIALYMALNKWWNFVWCVSDWLDVFNSIVMWDLQSTQERSLK